MLEGRENFSFRYGSSEAQEKRMFSDSGCADYEDMRPGALKQSTLNQFHFAILVDYFFFQGFGLRRKIVGKFFKKIRLSIREIFSQSRKPSQVIFSPPSSLAYLF